VSPADAAPATRAVWDLPVRLFHWLLVLACIGSYATNRIGVEVFWLHVWCGCIVLVLVAFRIAWGFAGTRHARFASFVVGPAGTLRYLRAMLQGRPPPTVGHNPLGAWMVLLLLAALAAQALTGLAGNDGLFNFGPLYAYVGAAKSRALTHLHKALFWWIAGAAGLHVLAVVLHRLLWRESLVLPMLTGRKAAHLVPGPEEISASRPLRALAIVLVLAAVLAWVILHAPARNSAFT
jgi:cytochrome b